jgi:hypothetical protein
MGIFDTVPRSIYEDAILQRDRAEARAAAADARLAAFTENAAERYAALVADVMDLKRHDLGMMAKDFDPTTGDPMKTLGPRTQLAIEEFAGGDAELRLRLITTAVPLMATARAEYADGDEADEHVAALIERGDTA